MPRKDYDDHTTERSYAILAPMITLSVFILLIGLFPVLVLPLLYHTLNQFVSTGFNNEFQSILSIYNWLSQALCLFGGLILFFLFIRFLLLRKRTVSVFKTWDCGYQAESSRIQYTGSSYSMPFLNLVAGLVHRSTTVKVRPDLFPKESYLETSAHDFTERYFIQPGMKFLQSFLNAFAWVQSGRMQQYILYGLIFLVILLVWIIGAM
jgi:hypothetical protein